VEVHCSPVPVQVFNEFGTVKESFIIKERSGRSKGFGFVLFSKVKYAQRALKASDISISGREIYCSLATAKPDRRSGPVRPAVNPSFGGGGYSSGGYGGGSGYGYSGGYAR
jgi:RNA recognition motif-containing protein